MILSKAALRHAVTVAENRLIASGRFPGVLGVAVGYRMRSGIRQPSVVLTVFVKRKRRPEDLDGKVPSSVSFVFRGRSYRIATDVVALGARRGHAQTLVVGDPVSLASGAASLGVVSWLSTGGETYGVTAEHVVGFGNVGAQLFSGGSSIGTVTASAYETHKIDAVLFSLGSGVQPSSVLSGHSLAPPRFVNSGDLTAPDGSNAAHAYLPHSGLMHDVAIRHVHVAGEIPLKNPLDGKTFYPRPLILTDLCTKAGDSGTLLLGADWSPLGLLSGISGPFSCFTELAPALEALGH